jgi:hypothetical protein
LWRYGGRKERGAHYPVMTSAGKQFHRSGFHEPKTRPHPPPPLSVSLYVYVCLVALYGPRG